MRQFETIPQSTIDPENLTDAGRKTYEDLEHRYDNRLRSIERSSNQVRGISNPYPIQRWLRDRYLKIRTRFSK